MSQERPAAFTSRTKSDLSRRHHGTSASRSSPSSLRTRGSPRPLHYRCASRIPDPPPSPSGPSLRALGVRSDQSSAVLEPRVDATRDEGSVVVNEPDEAPTRPGRIEDWRSNPERHSRIFRWGPVWCVTEPRQLPRTSRPLVRRRSKMPAHEVNRINAPHRAPPKCLVMGPIRVPVPFSVRAGNAVEGHREGDPFETGGPDANESEPGIIHELDRLCTGEYLSGPGPGCDPGGDVDRPAEHVAILGDHRACVDADVGGRQARARSALHHLQGGHHPRGRFLEEEHASVAQPPHRLPTVASGDVLDERGEACREAGRDLVPPLLRESGISGEVDEADGRRPREALVQTGALERCLGESDRDLGPYVLAMPLIDPQESSAHKRGRPLSKLRPVPHQICLSHTLLLEPRLHLRLVELRLRCGEPPKVVRVEMERASHSRLGRSCLQDRACQFDHHQIVLAQGFVWARWLKPDRLVKPEDQGERNALLLAELPIGAVRALGQRPPWCLEEGERELPLPDGGEDRLSRETGVLPCVEEGDPVDISFAVPVFSTLQSAQL